MKDEGGVYSHYAFFHAATVRPKEREMHKSELIGGGKSDTIYSVKCFDIPEGHRKKIHPDISGSIFFQWPYMLTVLYI